MIDINDYRLFYQRKIKRMNRYWIVILVFIIIGLILINRSFKYESYYQSKGEYSDNNLKIYVLVEDINKIKKNNELYIEKDKFAYKISSISEENIYLNGNYYKEIRLVLDNELIENDIVDIKIITKECSLLEYVFKTVWR